MRAFTVTSEQAARVSMGLAAEELGRSFGKHVSYLAGAGWTTEAAIGAGGLGLEPAERSACARRAAAFFGKPPDELPVAADANFGAWGESLAAAARESLTTFRFDTTNPDGSVKSCVHAADEIYQDALAASTLLHGRRRVISLVSPHSLVGFATTVLLPNLQALEAVDARSRPPEELDKLVAFGDVLVATPTLWRYLVSTLERLPDNIMGVSFGEPMAPNLLSDLRRTGLAAFREFYGSTEDGIIAWRDGPTEPFVLFDHWRRGEDGSLVRLRAGGEQRRVEPMDILDWRSDRAFSLAGRRDGAVQIAGVNVHPGRIGAIIAEHPDVGKCSVRVVRRRGGVVRLVADVTLNSGGDMNESIARRVDLWCRERLRPPERPRIYNFRAGEPAAKS